MDGNVVGRALRRVVRDLPIDTVRYLARIGGLLYLATGASVLQIVASASSHLERSELMAALGVGTVVVGVATIAYAAAASDAAVVGTYRALALALTFGAAVLVSVGLRAAGPALWSAGTAAYLLGPIFGFYVLRRSAAVALVAATAAGYASVLATGRGVTAAASQWMFLMSILVAVSVLAARLVERSDMLASAARQAGAELAEANAALAARVATQGDEVERLTRLRRFLSPPVADAVLAAGSPALLEPHRQLIAALCCDLRGFTRFAAASEPEDVVELIETYYDTVVELLDEFGATVGAFAGDGITAFFGDPAPCADPVANALAVAGRLRGPMEMVLGPWVERGHALGYGVGIAYGHATMGILGASGRCDYTALGPVVNVASRLCAEAGPGEVIIDQRAHDALRGRSRAEPCWLTLKGYDAPVRAYRIPADSMLVSAPAVSGADARLILRPGCPEPRAPDVGVLNSA